MSAVHVPTRPSMLRATAAATPDVDRDSSDQLAMTFGRINLSEDAEPALLVLGGRRRQRSPRPPAARLVPKGPPPNSRHLPAAGDNWWKVARAQDGADDVDDSLVCEDILDMLESLPRRAAQPARPPSVEQIEQSLRQSCAAAAAAGGASPAHSLGAAPSESSSDDAEEAEASRSSGSVASASGDTDRKPKLGVWNSVQQAAPSTGSPAAGDTQYHRFARHTESREALAMVKELNYQHLSNCSLADLLCSPSIKSVNSQGHAALMLFVAQQNLEAVRHCCLFASSSDESLFRALAEAALLPSDAIFCALLHLLTCSATAAGDEDAGDTTPLCDRPVLGWTFLNSQLNEFRGCTLAQLLRNQPARLAALQRAMQQQQQQQHQHQQRQQQQKPQLLDLPDDDDNEDFLKVLLQLH